MANKEKRPAEYYVGFYCDIQVPECSFPFYQPSFLAERKKIVGVSEGQIIIQIDDYTSMQVQPDTIKPYMLGERENLLFKV